jgi:hypothetical protein
MSTLVAIVLLFWSGSALDDTAANRAACAVPKRSPDIQHRVRTIRFRGGEGGSGRFEPYHFEEAH